MKRILCLIIVFSICFSGLLCKANEINTAAVKRFEIKDLPDEYAEYNSYYLSDNGYIAFGTVEHQYSKYEIADTDGNILNYTDYSETYLQYFDGLAAVRKKRTDKSGYINPDGKFAIPPIFDNAENFSEGFARVSYNGKAGFIDTNGNMAFIAENITIESDYRNGGFHYSKYDGKQKISQGYMDINGNVLFETGPQFYIPNVFENYTEIYDNPNKTHYLRDFEGNIIETLDNSSYSFSVTQRSPSGIYIIKNYSTSENRVYSVDKSMNKIAEYDGSLGDKYNKIYNLSINFEKEDFWCANSYNEKTISVIVFDKYFNIISEFPEFSLVDANNGRMLIRKNTGGLKLVTDSLHIPGQMEKKIPENILPYSKLELKSVTVAFQIGGNKVYKDGQINFIDYESDETYAFTKDGRAMLPLVCVSDNFAPYRTFYNDRGEISVCGFNSLFLWPDNPIVTVREFDFEKGDYIEYKRNLDVPPIIENKKRFLPVRAIAEFMNKNIFWYEDTQMVIVSDKNSISQEEYQEIKLSFENSAEMEFKLIPRVKLFL
jgi:hypothetical protein